MMLKICDLEKNPSLSLVNHENRLSQIKSLLKELKRRVQQNNKKQSIWDVEGSKFIDGKSRNKFVAN